MSTKIHGIYSLIARVILGASLCAGIAGATSVPRLSFEQLVDESDAVVTGVVSRTWSEWDTAHKVIWTRSEIVVHQAQKGAAAKTVVVSEPGGEVGGVGMSVAGSVRYKTGDQVVVFLKNYAGVGYRTHGWGQGKYVVDAGGRLHADDSLRAVEITSVQGGSTQSGSGQHAAAAPAARKLDGVPVTEAQHQIAIRVRRGVSQ